VGSCLEFKDDINIPFQTGLRPGSVKGTKKMARQLVIKRGISSRTASVLSTKSSLNTELVELWL